MDSYLTINLIVTPKTMTVTRTFAINRQRNIHVGLDHCSVVFFKHETSKCGTLSNTSWNTYMNV